MAKIEQWYRTAYRFQSEGNLAAAEPLYRRILEAQPRHLEALYLLGSLCAQQSRYAEALPLLESALAIQPQFAEALNNRGVALAALERWDEALESYAASVRLRPDYAEALNNQGIALQKAERLDDAIESFQKASEFRKDYAQALNNLGIALKTAGRTDEAEAAFRRAMAAQPDYPEAVNNVGLTHLSRGEFADALYFFDQAITLQSEFPQAHNNRGAALKELGRYAEAQDAYRHAFSLKADYVEACYNLGTCLVAEGRLEEARYCYDQALSIRPDDANAHWNRALGLLVAGDYEEGWREYEWRFRCKAVTEHVTSKPRWDGSPLTGRTILVHAEQGFGDTLNFLRYLPLVKAQGGRVLFECQPALLSLLEGYPGIDFLVSPPPQGQDHAETYDVQIPLLSLPGLYGTTPETIPAETPRLQAPAHFAEAWRARMAEIGDSVPGRLKVGLVWAGNPSHKNDHNRSCSLAELAPLAQAPGVVFYSLQKGPAAAQTAAAPTGMTLIDLGPALADFADTAAVIEQLDLVIAVDTSVVHLAGALGKPAWMLTPHGPDWRWLMHREDSPWYASVRLFRQSTPRDWKPVIARIAAELQAFAAHSLPVTETIDPVTRGEACYASGDTVEALRWFEEAIAQDPADARAFNNIAVLAYEAGGYDAAIQVLTQALAVAPEHPDALENMARCREAKGEFSEAAGWYQKALAVTPHRTALWNALGRVCLRLGETQAAREVFEQSLILDSTQESVRDALAALTDAPNVAEAVSVPDPISPNGFLHSFRRTDLDACCRSYLAVGEALARTAYARRDSDTLQAGGVANADSRIGHAEQEWEKIAARLPELQALEKAGYAAVSQLPEWESQLRPALEVFCHTGTEYHLLQGFLKGRTEVDAWTAVRTNRTNEPLVSVVIPCYNYARFLPDSVGSVLAQTYQNWELVIVNDGSTDDTVAVAERLIAAHPERHIRLISQQNARLATARNTGIRAAQGRYILPLDADDLLEPTMLAECVAVLENNPHLSLVYTDQRHFDEQGHEHTAYSLDWDFAQEIHYNHVCVSSLFRRTMWEDAGGYREDAAGMEDWDFWIACGKRGHQGWRLPQTLFRYRKHGASLSANETDKQHFLRAGIVLAHAELYAEATVRWAKGVCDGYHWLTGGATAARSSEALVSVIVPTYNRPQMLRTALQSILAQTYPHFEIIVVNDAGVDVRPVIDPLNATGKIRLIDKPSNRGQADSRNVGIDAARGKYIAYLDDDDLYYTDHIETLVTFLENTDHQVAYTDALRAHQRKAADGTTYEVWHRDQPYAFDFDYDQILTGNFIPIQCFMHAKCCLAEVGAFDTTLTSHEDWELWIRLSRRYDCIHLKKTTSEFTWRQDGTSWTGTQQQDYARTTALIYRKNRASVQHSPQLRTHYDTFLQKWEQAGHSPDAGPAASETSVSPATITLTARTVKARGLAPYKPCPCGSGERLKFCHYNKEIDARTLAQATQNWKTDIIIVVHNQLDDTRRCVESLYRHTQDFHLLLWDNGSDAPTHAYLAEVGRRENVTLRRSDENLGFIVPNNRLAAQGRAPSLILLNSDTEVQPGWDTALTGYLAAHPDAGAVGYEGGLLGPDALGCGQGQGDEIDYVAGWCLCLSRRTYEARGLFDEQNLQFAYGEDSDLSLRLQEAGLKIHALSDTRVTHSGNKTIREVSRKRDTRPTFEANHAYLRRRWAWYLAQHRVLAHQERARQEAWERQIADAEALYASGDTAGAAVRFQALAAQEPTDVRVLNNLGVALWQQGEMTESLRHFLQALQTDLDDRTSVLNCAEALQALGQTGDAVQFLGLFVQKHPHDGEASALHARLRGTPDSVCRAA